VPQLSQKITDALNQQINDELSSAYAYLAMSAWADTQNLTGAAHWLRLQWEEELGHATKLIDYMAERDGRIVLSAIDQPQAQFTSLLQVFETVLQHETDVTAAIYRIYDLAVEEKDFAAQALLQWYVEEQVEEENSASEIISMLKLAGDSGSGLLMVDRQLAARAAAPTAQ
jgi:ferritin